MEKDKYCRQADKENRHQGEALLFRQSGKEEAPCHDQKEGKNGEKECALPGVGKKEGHRSGAAQGGEESGEESSFCHYAFPPRAL